MKSFYCKVIISNITDKELHYRCSPVIFGKLFRAATLKITCEQMFLKEYLVKPKLKINNLMVNLEPVRCFPVKIV